MGRNPSNLSGVSLLFPGCRGSSRSLEHALALVAAGCGGGDDATPTPPEDAFTAAQVEQAFGGRGGTKPPAGKAGADEAWEQPGSPEPVASALQRSHEILQRLCGLRSGKRQGGHVAP